MNLFPRKYKEKMLLPGNRLEAHNDTTPTSLPPLVASGSGGNQRKGKMRPEGEKKGEHQALGEVGTGQRLAPPAPPPVQPQVWLTTVSKDKPLVRHRRDVTRQRGGQAERGEKERRWKDEQDALDLCTHTTSAFNAVLRTAGKRPREERKSMATRVVSRMRGLNIPLDKETFNLLLALLLDTSIEDCFAVYDQMKEEAASGSPDIKPDLQTFQNLMRACERTGNVGKAFELFTEMKTLHGVIPDATMYNTLLGFCVLRRDEQQASQLFEDMKELKVVPNVHTYNCLMNVFSESPTELLAQMFEDMVKQRIHPNLRTYNTLMRACQRVSDYDKAFKLFEELKTESLQPDVVTYNILIDMCRERLDAVQGRKNAASNRRNKEQQESGMRAIAVLSLSLFNEMDERDVRPNTFTYNALMGVLARCGDLRIFTVFRAMKEDAKEEEEDRARLQELLKTGNLDDNESALMLTGLGDVKGGGTTPGPAALIDDKSGATLRGHYQQLLIGDEYMARQGAFGVKPDIMTYQTLIMAAGRMARAETAFEIAEEMKEAGIALDNKTYILLMQVCTINNETGKALVLFREALDNKITPDVELYNAFLNVLAEAGDEVIFEAFSELASDSVRLCVKPNQQTYNLLIKACANLQQEVNDGADPPTTEEDLHRRAELLEEQNRRRLEKAFSIYAQMCDGSSLVPLGADTYNVLLDVCSISKSLDKAQELMVDMKQREIQPTITTYNKLMGVFAACEDEGITEVFQVLKSTGDPPPDLESYSILLSFYAVHRDPTILTVFDDLKKAGLDPDAGVYNIMLKYCALIQDKRKSLKFFEELKLRDLPADIDTYNALMAVFSESGDDLIFKVFEEMIENNITPDKTTFSTLIKQKKGLDCLRKAGEKGLLDSHKEEVPQE